MRMLLIIGAILMLTVSCQQRFNSEKWKIEGDLGMYSFRDGMVADVIENKNFIGQNWQQVIDSLGQPSDIEKNKMYYSIETKYGSDIDPVYTKNLVLTLDKDSLVTLIKIEEWKK